MPRFFVDSSRVRGDHVSLSGADAAHLIGPLRVQRGEHIVVVEGGRQHDVVVHEITPEGVIGRIAATCEASGEPALRVHVLQAIPARGMDDAVEALALAGAASIQPVITTRSVARPASERAAARVGRWRAIALEAAQLAGRAQVAEIAPVRSLSEAVAAFDARWPILACTMDAQLPLSEYVPDVAHPIALVIGPEGGLDARDMGVLHAHGDVQSVHLGERAMPARLAGVVALTLLFAASGDLSRAHTAPTT